MTDFNWNDPAFLALTDRIDSLLKENAFVWMAIDGRCASGKSTLGEALRERYDARLMHMDDFYIPFAEKTKERLSQPGGNVDYERFNAEVLSLPRDAAIPYRRFDCASQSILSAEQLPPRPLTIVEGSYSLHPALRHAYDLRVFMTINAELQRERIRLRNGAEKLRQFENMWIPLEEAYFAAENVQALCDVVIGASGGIDLSGAY